MRDRQLAGNVIEFLAQQALDATPDNYTLGYLHLSGADPMLSRAIDAVLLAGIRLSQADADEILAKRHLKGEDAKDASGEVRLQVLRLADLSADTAKATGRFGRELAENAAHIEAAPDGARILGLVHSMVEHTHQAEAQLQQVTAEAVKLRTELEAARSDALLDPLTGLANRRGVDAEINRLAAAGEGWSLAICDIDHFKLVNDRFGHAVGDRVLKAVASTLGESCRPHMVARWGGEEFIVLMGGIDCEGATQIIDDARLSLGERRLKLRETDEPLGRITLSAGIAYSPGGADEALVSRADALLYQAKQAGRDRVLCE